MSKYAPIVFDAEAVRRLLPAKACIDVMADAMVAISNGETEMPQRLIVPVSGQALLGVMPSAAKKIGVFGAKIVSAHHGNAGSGVPVIQGYVVLFEVDHGSPFAIVEAAELTARRTAAASALATRLLARRDARTHGIFGSGVQARSHAEAIATAMPDLGELRIWGRSTDAVKSLIENLRGSITCKIRACENPAEAAECDIVTCVTSSPEPVLAGETLRPGAHVNLIGAHTAKTREADGVAMARGRIFVDHCAAAKVEAGDILLAIDEEFIRWDDVAGELGEVVSGLLPGRTSDDEISIFKSVGLAVQDIYAANAVYRAASSGSWSQEAH